MLAGLAENLGEDLTEGGQVVVPPLLASRPEVVVAFPTSAGAVAR